LARPTRSIIILGSVFWLLLSCFVYGNRGDAPDALVVGAGLSGAVLAERLATVLGLRVKRIFLE
jgi:hypothetical protein